MAINENSSDVEEAFNRSRRRAVRPGLAPHSLHRRSRNHYKLLIGILVLLFIAIGVVAFSANGAPAITSATSFVIGQGSSTNFMVQNSSRVYTLFVRNATAVSATLYVSAFPILANPILSITGYTGAAYNISTAGTGNANINVRIVTSNSTAVKVQLTPIPLGLSIPSSSYAVVINPSPLPVSGSQTAAATTVSTTTAPTTTISSSGSSTVTSTATTTVAQTQVPAAIISAANSTYLGALMNNLNVLYKKASACTPSIYNQTFKAYLGGQSPVPPLDYFNVTLMTPTSYNSTITALSSTSYVVKYAVTTPAPSTSGTVIVYNMSSSGVVTNVKFAGLFTGENYTDIDNGYKSQAAIQNPCSALIS